MLIHMAQKVEANLSKKTVPGIVVLLQYRHDGPGLNSKGGNSIRGSEKDRENKKKRA